MKRFLSILAAIAFSMPLFAQWQCRTFTDDYTEKKFNVVSFTPKNKNFYAGFYPGVGLTVWVGYTSSDDFDFWWDIQMDHGGNYTYESEVGFNFIGNKPQEYVIDLDISHEKDINYPNDLTFSFSLLDSEDGELLDMMKSNTKLNIKYFDMVLEKYNVLQIPLSGFTTAYNKAMLPPGNSTGTQSSKKSSTKKSTSRKKR